MANTKIPSELVAINAISGTLIADNAITSVHIAQNNITATQIAINAVTALQMADGTITSAKIADGTIVTADIADGQITTAKIADSSVTTGKIAAGTILGGDIANNAILTQHIDDNQITADQIADNAVGLGQLASIARGKIIVGDSAGNPTYLALGGANTLLQSDGTDLFFGQLQSGIDDNSNAVAITIDASENVGIGPLTSSPDSRLHVFSGVSSTSDWGNLGIISDFPINNAGRIYTAYLLQDSQSIKSAAIGHSYDGTGYKMHFGTASSTSSGISNTALTINRLGEVGIGTNAPIARLHIKDNTSVTYDATAYQHDIFLEKRNTAGANQTTGLRFAVTGYDGSTTAEASIGILQTSNAHSGNLVFGTRHSGTRAERMRITSDGSVGINAASPAATLHTAARAGTTGLLVAGAASNNIVHFARSDGVPSLIVNSDGKTVLRRSGSAGEVLIFEAGAAQSGGIQVQTTGLGIGGGAQENQIFLKTDGKVGIGETSPSAKLHVKKTAASTQHYDLYATAIIEDTEGRLQIVATDGGSNASALLLSNEEKHWGVVNHGPSQNNTFGIGYYASSSTGGDFADSLSSPFTITTGGNVGIGGSPTAGKLDIEGGSSGVSVRVKGDVGGGAYYYGYMFDGTNVRGTTQTNIFYSGSAIAANTTIAEYAGIRIDQPITSASGAVVTNNYAIYSSGSAQKSYFAGKVGIGTTTPESNHSKANNLVVGGGGAGGMAVYNGTAEGWYAFSRSNANNTDAYDGGMSYTDRVLRLHTNAGGTRLKIDGSGDTEIYGHLSFEDNKLLMFGGGQDARLYFDATTNTLMITASNGTANTVNITTNNFQIGGATPLISGTANDSVVINQDGASNVDFRVETDNEQYALFVDASSEIIHVGEGTNSDLQQVIPAKTLHYRRHGYHGGNRTHGGRTFKYSEGNSWTDAVKIEWNNASWGAVNMRIKGQGYYNTTDAFDVVISFQGHAAHVGGNFGATSVVGTYTHFINIVRDTTGETTIQQRNSNNSSNAEDIVFMYEWVTNNRSDQTILVTDL